MDIDDCYQNKFMMKKLLQYVFIFTAGCCLFSLAFAVPFSQRKDVQTFIHEMHTKYQFDQTKLIKLFQQVHFQPRVIKKIKHPLEANHWYLYRAHFVTKQRITKGVKFWRKYRTTLKRVEKIYGVPPQIIVAIIGIETNYGAKIGKFRTIDALATLTFQPSRRSNFFKKELQEFLLLCRENRLNPLKIYGSYAGAVGQPQFMPSSYRHYAVNFDKSNYIDLWHDIPNVIASIANYLSKNGWQKNDDRLAVKINFKKEYPKITDPANVVLDKLKKYAIFSKKSTLPLNHADTLIKLKTKNGFEYWLGLHNLYVITHYNASILYAMAVCQLAANIKQNYQKNIYKKVSKLHAKTGFFETIYFYNISINVAYFICVQFFCSNLSSRWTTRFCH